MTKENSSIYYDKDLDTEIYMFNDFKQAFSNHFHDYYVIGCIKKGSRWLFCNNQKHQLKPGSLMLLNPHDTHSCAPIDSELLKYYCLNIKKETMQTIYSEITGENLTPAFIQCCSDNSSAANLIEKLYTIIQEKENGYPLEKEEVFYKLMKDIIQKYTSSHTLKAPEPVKEELSKVVKYIENNYTKTISLSDLSKITNISKYHLLHIFKKETGISPYRYLKVYRTNKAKELMKSHKNLQEIAMLTGFSDQSHFSNCFKEFTGLTPKQYLKIYGVKKTDGQSQ